MPIINGKEFELKKPMMVKQGELGGGFVDVEVYQGNDADWNTLLLALDGLSFEKKEEQKPFSVDNPPKEGETYFHIIFSPSLIITEECFVDDDYDEHCVSQNNCFRTKEEAEAALSRVLQALKC